MGPKEKADLTRILLLNTYGGIWVDTDDVGENKPLSGLTDCSIYVCSWHALNVPIQTSIFADVTVVFNKQVWTQSCCSNWHGFCWIQPSVAPRDSFSRYCYEICDLLLNLQASLQPNWQCRSTLTTISLGFVPSLIWAKLLLTLLAGCRTALITERTARKWRNTVSQSGIGITASFKSQNVKNVSDVQSIYQLLTMLSQKLGILQL